MKPRDTQGRVQFIDRAVGFDAKGMLGREAAIATSGFAGIAGAGVDLV